jgi:hypothetical protein
MVYCMTFCELCEPAAAACLSSAVWFLLSAPPELDLVCRQFTKWLVHKINACLSAYCSFFCIMFISHILRGRRLHECKHIQPTHYMCELTISNRPTINYGGRFVPDSIIHVQISPCQISESDIANFVYRTSYHDIANFIYC